MAPWNGGSGFYFQEEKSKEKDPETGKKKKTGVRNQATAATKTVDAVLQSKSNRLCEYRSVLTLGKDVVQGLSFDQAPENGKAKDDYIQNLRGSVPERGLECIINKWLVK